MLSSEYYIHIGYHKTGTTFLQTQVFPAIPVNLLLMPDIVPIARRNHFDPDRFRQHLGNQAAGSVHARTIISQETLSGRGDGNPIWDPHLIAKRLQQTFPNAKILIVIRNQFDYILSLYAFRVVRRGLEHRTLDGFLALKQDWLCQKLQYDLLIGDYVRLFGRERVLVLPYELLVEDESTFVRRIATFFDHTKPILYRSQKVNPSTRNGRLIRAHRLLNTPFSIPVETLRRQNLLSQKQYTTMANRYFFLKKMLINPLLEHWLGQHQPEPLVLSPAWREQLLPGFQASNHRLAAKIDINLQAYHYPW